MYVCALRLMTHQTLLRDFCCATLLRNKLRTATSPNAAATKRATKTASSYTKDDVFIAAMLMAGVILNEKKRNMLKLTKDVCAYMSSSAYTITQTIK